MRKVVPLIIALLAGALLSAAVIYLTPLKWVTIIQPTINDISAQTFYAEFKAHPEKYLFVDVRMPNEFAQAHAVGSINIPLIDLYEAHNTLPKSGKEIVLICTEGRSSGVAYSYLQHYGFFNIVRIDGGLVKWTADGLPVEGAAVQDWVNSDHSKQSASASMQKIVEANACPTV